MALGIGGMPWAMSKMEGTRCRCALRMLATWENLESLSGGLLLQLYPWPICCVACRRDTFRDLHPSMPSCSFGRPSLCIRLLPLGRARVMRKCR